jgi:hypothetical protein
VADKPSGQAGGSPSLVADARDLWELVRDYALQEVKAPLTGAARFVGFGVAGALLLGVGSSLVALALLRFLQTETGRAFAGHLSFVPYVIVVAVSAGVVALAATRTGTKEHRRG